MNRNASLMFVWVCLLSVPHILGATSDFPEKKRSESRALEAEEASENKERVDREHQEPTENNKRKPRQSFSFTTFPFQGGSTERNPQDGPLSFQSVRMGPDSTLAFQGFNFDNVFTPSSSSPSSTSPSSTFSRPASSSASRTRGGVRPLENFPNFNNRNSAGSSATVRSQDSFSPTLRPAGRTVNFARNRDPRRRMRNRSQVREPTPAPEQPRRLNFVEVTPARPLVRINQQKKQPEAPLFRARDNVRDNSRDNIRDNVRDSSRNNVRDSSRDNIRNSIRVSSLVASDVQNSLQETVRSLEEASKRNDELIQNCISEAEKHQADIEELENRTALHIEYAQEKQIEIQQLEIVIEKLRNQSLNHTEIETDFQKRIGDFAENLQSKDSVISKLKDDIVKLEQSFSKEESEKHHEISTLNDRLDNASVELADNQIRIEELLEQNRNNLAAWTEVTKYKDRDLQEFHKKMEKFKREKLNLLKIVQQLADLGNPANNPFNIEDSDYDLLNSAEEDRENCCDETADFAQYDVNVEQINRDFVSSEEYGDEDYREEEEEEGSTSLENLVEATENADGEVGDQPDAVL